MNKAEATLILNHVRETYGTDEPALYPAEHEDLRPGNWSIAWECCDDWTIRYSEIHNEAPLIPGIFVEPMAGWCLVLVDDRD